MALKFRGKTQIKDASLSLDKLAHSSQKRLVGNQSDSFGESTTLTNHQSRNLMGLGIQDSAGFAGLTSATITSTQSDSASDSLKSLGSLSVTDSSGTTTLSGKLDVQGTGNTASGLTVNAGGSFEVDSTGSADFNSDLTVTNSSLTTDTLSVTQSGAGSATLTGHVDFDSSLTVDGLATLSGGILVNNSNITHSRDSAGVNVALTSPNVSLNSGNIDGVIIGSDSAADADFTSLIAVGDVTVNGNLTVQTGSTSSKLETELEISDPLLLLAKDNPGNTLDMGIVGKYETGSGSNIVVNGTFDSDVSNWSDSSSATYIKVVSHGIGSVSVPFYYSRSHSSDFGSGALKLSAGRFPFSASNSSLVRTAASQQTVSHSFTNQTYTLKFKIYYNDTTADGGVTSDSKYRIILHNETNVSNGMNALSQSGTATSGTVQEQFVSLPSSGTEVSFDFSGGSFMVAGETTSEILIGFNLAQDGGGADMNYNGSGAPTTGRSSVIYIDDVKIYDANGDEVIDTSSTQYSGILRDADGSGNFKLFSSSDSTIPSSQSVNFLTSSKSVLDADIEGDITYDVARNFSLSGDAASAPQMYYGSGNTVTMISEIQDGSIQVGNIDFLVDQDDMVYPGEDNFGSPIHVPSQQSVKAYVSDTISRSSYTGLQPKEIRMARSVQGGDVSFVSVEKVFFKRTCDSTDQGNDYVTLSREYEIDFVPKSEVYLNGQKLRYGQSYDYYFSESNKLNLNNDILYSGDRIEVQYFVESAAVKTNSHTGRTGITKLASGWNHTLIVNDDGRLFVSGGNSDGQLGLGDTQDLDSELKLNNYFANNSKTIVDAAGGKGFSLFVDDDGKVYSSGEGGYGQLGLNSTTDYTIPQEITYFSTAGITIVKVFAGEYHSMALDDNGNLYGWGRNDKGQLGLGHFNSPVLVPTALDMSNFDGDPTKVDLGGLHSLVITDQDKSYTFGDNSEGQLGIGNTTNQHTPQLVNSNTLSGATGGDNTLLLTKDGQGGPGDLLGSGNNKCGQLAAPLVLGTLPLNPLNPNNLPSNRITTLRPIPGPLNPDNSGNHLKVHALGSTGRNTAMVVQKHGDGNRDLVVRNDQTDLCDSNGDTLDCCGSEIPDPVYSVLESSSNVDEGSDLTINVTTENVLNDTVLYWTIESSETNSSDFSSVSGNFSIDEGVGSFTVSPLEDNLTEGVETFTVAIRTGSTNGTKVAETGSISINDTSQDPPTYDVTPAVEYVYEGGNLPINVTTTNVEDETKLYWTIESNASEFSVSSGEFEISGGKGVFQVSPILDSLNETGDTFTVAIRTGSTNGTKVAETDSLDIKDKPRKVRPWIGVPVRDPDPTNDDLPDDAGEIQVCGEPNYSDPPRTNIKIGPFYPGGSSYSFSSGGSGGGGC